MFKSRIMLAMALTALLAMGFALVGCGGSSGGSSIGGGGVGKSPVNGATVAARNLDGSWTTVGTTGASGAITFTSALDGYTSSQYPLVLRATGGTLTGGASFAGEMRGILESSTSNAYITPASTMVAALYDAGKTLEEAQTQVRAIVQNTLGYTTVDPLGNFLASSTSTRENEMAQQALLFCLLGTTDVETNANTMANLLSVLETASTDLASGSKDISTIIQENSGYDGTGSIAAYVTTNESLINQAAADALGVATSALPTITIDTSAKPEKFVVNLFTSAPAGDTNAVTAASDNNSEFVAAYDASSATLVYIGIGLTSSTGTWTTASDSNYSFTAIPSAFNLFDGNSTSDTAVTTSTVFTPATGNANGIGAAPVITIQIPAGTAVGTYTMTVQAASTTGATVARTVTVQIVDATSTTIASGIAWDGTVTNDLLQFTDTATTNTLNSGATRSVATGELGAAVTILGGASKSEATVDAQYYVGFVTPEGFAFSVSGTNYTNYDLATFSQVGSTAVFDAAVPNTVSLVTTADKAFGPYAFKANLVNKSNSSIERTVSKTLYAIDSDFANSIARIQDFEYRYTNGTTTTSVTRSFGSNDYVSFDTGSTFQGSIITWTGLAAGSSAAPSSEPAGTWYLLTSDNSGLATTSPSGFTSNLDVDSTVTYSSGTLSVPTTNLYFQPLSTTNQDTISLKFVGATGYTAIFTSTGGVTVSGQ